MPSQQSAGQEVLADPRMPDPVHALSFAGGEDVEPRRRLIWRQPPEPDVSLSPECFLHCASQLLFPVISVRVTVAFRALIMRYTVVTEYYRQKQFDYYRRYRNPFYSLTFELDATELKAFVERNGYRTYLNLCYFFTRAAQGVEDLRYRLRGGELVLYERLHPGLTVPAADGAYSWLNLEFDEDVHEFNRRAAERWPSPDSPAEMAPMEHENQIYFTAIPGAVFTGFTHPWDDPASGAPRAAFGQPFEREDRLWVPVGVQVNHTFVDGRALGQLIERAQAEFSHPDQGLSPALYGESRIRS